MSKWLGMITNGWMRGSLAWRMRRQRFRQFLEFIKGIPRPWIKSVVGDAARLDYPHDAFDVVFSNSVIEHLGGVDAQRAMAREVQRVASLYYVQTPNRYFPIEPHFLFPCAQFLPRSARIWIASQWKFGSYC